MTQLVQLQQIHQTLRDAGYELFAISNDTVDRLTLLNIKGEEAVNPANGSECAWIPGEYADIAEQAGLTTWDAAGYMVLHLSSVLRKNAAEFVGIQEVQNMLELLGRRDLRPMITHRYALDDFLEAFDVASDPAAGAKVMVEIA